MGASCHRGRAGCCRASTKARRTGSVRGHDAPAPRHHRRHRLLRPRGAAGPQRRRPSPPRSATPGSPAARGTASPSSSSPGTAPATRCRRTSSTTAPTSARSPTSAFATSSPSTSPVPIDPDLRPGDLLCLDDFLDLTKQRPVTFFDGSGPEGVVHTDVLEPYHPAIRREILDAAAAAGQLDPRRWRLRLLRGAAVRDPRRDPAGPRSPGADVAGMTGVPEVTLAAEAGLRYAAISLVVNPASGVGDSDEPITMEEINEVLAATSADGARGPRRARPHPRHVPRRRRGADPRMTRVRIENATYVVTVDDADRVLRGHHRGRRGRRHHRDHAASRTDGLRPCEPPDGAHRSRRDRHRRPRQAR